MWHPPVLLAPILPAAEDPAVVAILEGTCHACGVTAARLSIRLLPDGPDALYIRGSVEGAPRYSLQLGLAARFRAVLDLCGPAANGALNPSGVERLRPLLDGVLLALIERCNASHQVEVLSTILGAATDASLLIDPQGEILWANQHGDELLALHTEQPLAQLEGAEHPAPLLHLVASQIEILRASGDRVRRQMLSTGDGGRWRLEIVAVSGLGSLGGCLVILSPVRLPTPQELVSRFGTPQVSSREAEVLSLVLRGLKTVEIAAQLGLSEYTIKDHLKHAYAKLGISSRGQLLSRIAAASPLGT